MVSFTVDTVDYIDSLREELSAIPNVILKTDKENCCHLNVGFKSEKEQFERFEQLVADFILKKYKNGILYNIIEKNYGCLTIKEKSKIRKTALKRSEEDGGESLKLIKNSLEEYFKTSNSINIDGFVRFRLNDYKSVLNNIVDECVEEYITQREYDEFLELLKCFVELQSDRIELLHIETQPDKSYRFFDGRGEDITYDCSYEIIAEDFEDSINYDDLLISVLIVLAPQKVIWHNIELVTNKELINTVKQIFEENVQFCEESFGV